MTNSNTQVYLCKEIFDENSEPTKIGNVPITNYIVHLH